MASKHEWGLVFTCPGCQRDSRVAAMALGSVLRCPNCRRKVVISKEGMKSAPRRAARAAASDAEKARWSASLVGWCAGLVIRQPLPAGPRPAGRSHRETAAQQRRAMKPVVMLALAALVVALVALPSAKLLSSRGPANSLEGRTRELLKAAESFQTAWLKGDLEAARAFVGGADKAGLERWSAPRRAALVAGFGARFDGRVTNVEIAESSEEAAIVQVRFQIRGRDQQVFQRWKRTDDRWLLTLRD